MDEDTDTLILNTVNNFLHPPEHYKLDKFAICIAWVHDVVMVRPGRGTSKCGSFDIGTEHRITTKRILKALMTMNLIGTKFL